MAKTDLVVAITGASGAPYGIHLLNTLIRAGRSIHLTISPAAVEVFKQEVKREIDLHNFRIEDLLGEAGAKPEAGQVKYHFFQDYQAGIASGSFLTGGMVICPCSMGTVAAIAHGHSQNLIHRSADVHLKERRKLVLVPRETPLSVVQLRNLATCAEVGAVVLPAMPGFYNCPESLQHLLDFVVARICDQLEVEHDLIRRWGNEK